MLRHELGPELLGLLTDSKITNIHANEDGSVFVRTTAGTEVDAGFRLERERRRAILTSCAALLGTVVSAERPALAGKLAAWSARLQATVEPLTTAPQFVLRKPSRRLLTLTDYVAQGTLGAGAALYLGQAVLDRRNLVIAGAADAGKTTFVNALLAHLLDKHPEERLVVIEEEARELRLEARNVVRLLATAGFTARELVRLALRENPSRLILGEARGAECYDWLRAAHTGHEGGLLTLHASSAADVLERLADMIAEAGVEPSPRRIARTVDLIVYLEHEEASGRRRVREVLEVSDAGAGETPRLLKIH
jgi:type IV secretion system protein VirB11